MNKGKSKYIFQLSMIFFILFLNPVINSDGKQLRVDQNADLVIYTYDSLMADPSFDIEGNFSEYSGLDIQIIRFEDANQIVSQLEFEQDNPVADVVIGIDNALIHSINKTELLSAYQPTNYNDIRGDLINNLDPDGFLWPYDYGIIALYYQNNVVNKSNTQVLNNLTLESLSNSDLLGRTIVENPKFSSPGLGFLLWTIAVYGDPQLNIDGLLKSDWRVFWNKAKDQVNITKSWGDAFSIFFEPSENKPMMVSYGTSPAYGYCLWGDNTTSAIISHERNQNNAWLQIEGIGLVNGAKNLENGKQFINWFLSQDVQSKIPTTQWMYPANTNALIPDCFKESSISPDSVSILNDILTPDILEKNLKNWQDKWEIAIVNTDVEGFAIFSFFSIFIILGLIRKKRKT